MSTEDNQFDTALIYKNVLQNMQDGVITVALDGTIISLNPAAQAIFMFDQDNLIGEHFTKIFSKLLEDPRNDQLNDAILKAIYESTVTHHIDAKYYFDKICKDLLVSSTALIVEKNGKNEKIGMILVISDISNRQRLAHLQKLFGKYIDPQLAKSLIDQSEEGLLKAKRQMITVSFCDMNNFTRLCENFSPKVIEQLMNAFFSKMSGAVHKNQGVIDKFIGDAIMSFWGFPLFENNNAKDACQTALEQLAFIPELNKEFQNIVEGLFKETIINISIGIATGELIIANIGSEEYKNITVLGNTVNVAARLVGANKLYGTSILVTEDTVKSSGNQFLFREIDTIRVKGKEAKSIVYELIGTKEALKEKQTAFLDIYANALGYYKDRNWKEARQYYKKALLLMPKDKPSKIFLDRSEFFIANPPSDSWDGVWILENK